MPRWILPGPPSQECGDAMCARERKGGFQDCFASIQNYIRNHPLQRARYGEDGELLRRAYAFS
jgi:hypothetical protein